MRVEVPLVGYRGSEVFLNVGLSNIRTRTGRKVHPARSKSESARRTRKYALRRDPGIRQCRGAWWYRR